LQERLEALTVEGELYHREERGRLRCYACGHRCLIPEDRQGIWMEIVTLVVPGWNSSDEELREAAKFLAGISSDIPSHITAFHKDYKMTEYDNTTSRSLLRAAEIGREEGLRFVYAGNLPGRVGKWEDTSCPGCGSTLIERSGFRVQTMRVDNNGNCPDCARKIPGIWGEVTTPGSGRVLPLHI
jgi:pyruvate formate lyase activating enzyme